MSNHGCRFILNKGTERYSLSLFVFLSYSATSSKAVTYNLKEYNIDRLFAIKAKFGFVGMVSNEAFRWN